jgi:hypothetical protein
MFSSLTKEAVHDQRSRQMYKRLHKKLPKKLPKKLHKSGPPQ